MYLITSLAVTRNGSRRMTQYEVARSQIPLNMPAALTFNGNPAYFEPPSSNAFEVNGTDNCGGPPKVALGGLNRPGCTNLSSAPVSPAPANQCASDYLYDIADSKRPDQYTSAVCTSTPCTGDVTNELNNQAQNLATRQGLEDLVAGIASQADETATTVAGITGGFGTATNPRIIVINNDGSPTNPTDGTEERIPSGYGILVVRGTAVLGGNQAWHGAVLVVGDGRLRKEGGGGGDTYGGMMVANTRWANNNASGLSTALPSTQLDPGPPFLDWNGGGNALIKFDSCAINNGTMRASYGVIAYREMTL